MILTSCSFSSLFQYIIEPGVKVDALLFKILDCTSILTINGELYFNPNLSKTSYVLYFASLKSFSQVINSILKLILSRSRNHPSPSGVTVIFLFFNQPLFNDIICACYNIPIKRRCWRYLNIESVRLLKLSVFKLYNISNDLFYWILIVR